MPVRKESPERQAIRAATVAILRRLADLVEAAHPNIEKIACDTIRDYPRTLALVAVEPARVTYAVEVVTWGDIMKETDSE